MSPEQDRALEDKLTRIGYPEFDTRPGEDDIEMLYIDGHLIGGALYALGLDDEALKALIDETVAVGGQG